MIVRIPASIIAICLMSASGTSVAQSASGDVTFRLPLNLTQLSLDVAKVAVSCNIISDAIPLSPGKAKGTTTMGTLSKQVEIPVSGGQLVTTAIVVVPVGGLDNPVGKTANCDCSISGYSTSLQQWSLFEEGHATTAFRLSPTPPRITGSFVW